MAGFRLSSGHIPVKAVGVDVVVVSGRQGAQSVGGRQGAQSVGERWKTVCEVTVKASYS